MKMLVSTESSEESLKKSMEISEIMLWTHVLFSIKNGKRWEPTGRFFYYKIWSGKIPRYYLSGVVSRANTTEILSLYSVWTGTTQSFTTNLHVFRLQLSKKRGWGGSNKTSSANLTA